MRVKIEAEVVDVHEHEGMVHAVLEGPGFRAALGLCQHHAGALRAGQKVVLTVEAEEEEPVAAAQAN